MNQMQRAGASPRPGSVKRCLTALALLAFFLQGLIIQTHIHQVFQPAAVKVQTGGSHTPFKPDPMDQCRLCQELVHAGAFVAPSAIASPVSLIFVAAGETSFPAFVADPAAVFAWQSRAPPRR